MLLCAVAIPASAHDLITTKITWSREISRLINARCISCHGASSPVPLSGYAEARPWAKAIRDEVLNRRMPPWGAVKGYGDLDRDPSLSQEQITQIAEWVEGGAPEGDARYLPATSLATPPVVAARGKFTRTTQLQRAGELRSIRPLQLVENSKLTAQLPDGSVVPLLWLRGYKAEWRHTFHLREPLQLPPGTRLVATPPFSFTVSLFPAP